MVQIRLLGSGNAYLPNGRLHSMLWLDGGVLIDAPPTILASLRKSQISPSDINSLLITHWHGDHTFGIPFFLLERKWLSDTEGKHKLHIHSPTGGKQRINKLCEMAFHDSLNDVLDERVIYHEQEGILPGNPEWGIELFRVEHDQYSDPWGYLLTHETGVKVLHTGDSGPCEAIEARIPSADIVFIDLGLPEGFEGRGHYTPLTLADLANRHPNTRFVATHTYRPSSSVEVESYSSELFELPNNVYEGEDGDCFELYPNAD